MIFGVVLFGAEQNFQEDMTMTKELKRVRDSEHSSKAKSHDHTPNGLSTKAVTPDASLPVERLMDRLPSGRWRV